MHCCFALESVVKFISSSEGDIFQVITMGKIIDSFQLANLMPDNCFMDLGLFGLFVVADAVSGGLPGDQ